MIPVFLTRIKTHDGIMLDGVIISLTHHSDIALLWIHGLSSRFSSGQTLIKELSQQCVKHGIGYFKFNTRGHDIVNRDAPKKKELQGAGFEKFEDCILDIRAMIRCARRLGYKKIILAGHSTGANKTVYYQSKTNDRFVKGIILIAPASDIPAQELELGKSALRKAVRIARQYKNHNFKLMPPQYGIITPIRFLSLYESGHAEDTFPYYHDKARWTSLEHIRVPIAVIFGSRDEYLGSYPLKKICAAFRKNVVSTKSFSNVIIKGAHHDFHRKEKELSEEIIRWISVLHKSTVTK